jgi:hypothetical protein
MVYPNVTVALPYAKRIGEDLEVVEGRIRLFHNHTQAGIPKPCRKCKGVRAPTTEDDGSNLQRECEVFLVAGTTRCTTRTIDYSSDFPEVYTFLVASGYEDCPLCKALRCIRLKICLLLFDRRAASNACTEVVSVAVMFSM